MSQLLTGEVYGPLYYTEKVFRSLNCFIYGPLYGDNISQLANGEVYVPLYYTEEMFRKY